MTEVEVLQWFSSTALGEFTRNEQWAFPIFEILHFLGLCTLFGALLIVDLRVLGLGKQVPMSAVMPFIPVAMFGFVLNLVSGVAFFCSDPENYWMNPAFHWKMYLVIFGGINALAFEVLERRKLAALGFDADPGIMGKTIAALSLTTWVLVIVLGRLLPYTSEGLG